MDRPLPMLLCVAAPAECESVLAAFDAVGETTPGSRTVLRPPTESGPGVELLATGVGPTAAGVSTAASLADAPASAVVSLGIAGAYPGSGIGVLKTVISTRSFLAGEGAATPRAFIGLHAMGFGPFSGDDSAATSLELGAMLHSVSPLRGGIATVSAVSGTDELAAALEHRTAAIAEAMEGAAIHLACDRAGIPFAEVRVISNIAGDRERHPWRLQEALKLLGPVAVRVADAILS
ncbi:MAG: futalosine hydrolase [Planctomycetota bacterium]